MNALEQLWRRRRSSELKELLPYWKYVIGSGFGLFAAAAAILAVQGYIMALREAQLSGSIPFPLEIVAALTLTPLLLWNPVRTYVEKADMVFLVPAESRMDAYLRPPKLQGAVRSAIGAAAVLMLLWPFYAAIHIAIAGAALHYGVIAAAVIGLKALLSYGAWMEKQYESHSHRLIFFLIKALGAFASVHYLFRSTALWYAILVFLVIWAAYGISLRIPGGFHLNWERLIKEEHRTRAMMERWFSQFVDLPRSEEVYRRRAYLLPLLSVVAPAFGKRNPYLYLYWRRLLRSSAFWIMIRLILLDYAFVYLFPGEWTALSLFALFAFLIGIQLKSMQSIRTEVLHLTVSPVPEEERAAAIRTIRRTAHQICVILLALPLFGFASWEAAAVASAVGLLWPVIVAWKRPAAGRRRIGDR